MDATEARRAALLDACRALCHFCREGDIPRRNDVGALLGVSGWYHFDNPELTPTAQHCWAEPIWRRFHREMAP